MDDVKIIKAKGGIDILVSAQDYENLNNRNWYISRDGYALCNTTLKKMHRLILDANENQVVDHINRDKLNNTRENLRIVNRCENVHNQKKRTKTQNNYKGANYVKRLNLYQSRCRIYGNDFFLGYYDNEIAAGYAYNKKAKELSDKCVLNEFDLSENELEELLVKSLRIIPTAEFKSKEKHVFWNKTANKWQVSITVNGKNHYLGKYKNEEEAVKVIREFKLSKNII